MVNNPQIACIVENAALACEPIYLGIGTLVKFRLPFPLENISGSQDGKLTKLLLVFIKYGLLVGCVEAIKSYFDRMNV